MNLRIAAHEIHFKYFKKVAQYIRNGGSLQNGEVAQHCRTSGSSSPRLFTDLNYDIDIPNEELLKHFIKNELYEYKEIELSEILYQIGCGDIYEAAGFAHVDDENDEDFF